MLGLDMLKKNQTLMQPFVLFMSIVFDNVRTR